MILNFKEKVNQVVLESLLDSDIVGLDSDSIEAWEFAKIYNCPPYYFNYTPTREYYMEVRDLAHEEEYDDIKSYLKIREFLQSSNYENYVKYGEYLFTDFGVITTDNIKLLKPELPDIIKDNLVECKSEHHFYYASVGNGGFTTKSFPIKDINDDILDNYNADFPLDKFENFIDSDESGIAIMNGIPGTGKSHMIRYFIANHPNSRFIWFDQALLTQATSDAFVKFILDNRNSILILEDCEILLKSRDQGGNEILNTVLNIADGIIGDSLNIKFICTFNTDYTNIDKAVTRKGRLKVKYEFKELTKDRVANLFTKFGIKDTPKPMALCDIYNYDVVTGGEEKRTKIGF